MTVVITDELGMVFRIPVKGPKEAMDVVHEWLKTLDSTPLQSIEITL